MGFLWFGKKKKATRTVLVEAPEPAKPIEVFSVENYLCDTNPLGNSGKSGASELSHALINSVILTLLSQGNSPAEIAAQEFFQQRGAIELPISDYSFTPDRGYSARIDDGDGQRTVLIGAPAVVQRATTPLSAMLASAINGEASEGIAPKASSAKYLVAIDGIAYVSFEICSSII